MNAVNERECDALIARFDELDNNGSGILDLEDIKSIAARRSGKAAALIKVGSLVKIRKSGSSKFGAEARVIEKDWNGLVRVILVGDTEVKSYKKIDLDLLLEARDEIDENVE